MADTKISALTELAAAPAASDLVPLVDVSDTTQAASGTTKKITPPNLFRGANLTELAEAPARTDTVIVDDLSASSAKKITHANLLRSDNLLSLAEAPAATDTLIIDDQSATTAKKITQTNLLTATNLTELNAAPAADDLLIISDTSGGGGKKITPPNLLRGDNLANLGTWPAGNDLITIGDVSAGAAKKVTINDAFHFMIPGICGCRLSLGAGSIIDSSGSTNIRIYPHSPSPFAGWISLYDGTNWNIFDLSTGLTAALGTLTSGKNYDVFAWDDAGSVNVEYVAWTDDTTRATALGALDGIYTKSGDNTRKYLGTFRTISTTQVCDEPARRFVYNHFNPVPRRLYVLNNSTYTYGSATIRQMNATSSNRIEIVRGAAEVPISLAMDVLVEIGTDEWGNFGVGENSTTTFSSDASKITLRGFSGAGNLRFAGGVSYIPIPRVGYSAYNMLEQAEGGTIQMIGNNRLHGTAVM